MQSELDLSQIEISQEEADKYEAEFIQSATDRMAQNEKKWRESGTVFARIDGPEWVSAIDWETHGILPKVNTPQKRTFRLSLLGGGQVKVVEKFVLLKIAGCAPSVICDERRLLVQAHVDGQLRYFLGTIDDDHWCEMSSCAVLLPQATPQDVADRVASTLRTSGTDKETFYALLARGVRCCVCQRPLKDETSKLLGIGPECAGRMGLQHNTEMASKVLARRRELGLAND